jgi:hypothetical protein
LKLQSRYLRLMASRSFFIQCPEDALRHVNLLAIGLKKLAIAGLVGGTGCSILALLLGHILVTPSPQSNAIPGFREMSGVTFVAMFMALAFLVFSSLYLVVGRGLSQQKAWARYTGAATFVAKVLLCVWLGRATISAMTVFLFIASWDLYGLWVLLSKETAHLFRSNQRTSQASIKPANLVT